jgi:predicted CXXCH cytochrome family protein
MESKRLRSLIYFIAAAALLLVLVRPGLAADDQACLECHGSKQLISDAAGAMDLKLAPEKIEQLVRRAPEAGTPHAGVACLNCHPKAGDIPHPAGMLKESPCVTCHENELNQVNKSAHRDPKGGSDLRAPCWACHKAHDIRAVKDPNSAVAPFNVASRCLNCHDKGEYLVGVHGQAVQHGGLDFAATCVSCRGGHDILAPTEAGSRVARRNISFTCGKCHGRVAEAYRKSVHGAALAADDNPDVPTCVDCHEAHGTVDPLLPRFRLASPEICGRCHRNKTMMGKYGLSTAVYDTYVADFHGTTAELFRATSPDQPLNKAVCYDCHGYHDVESVRTAGDKVIKERLLVRCQVCHPKATAAFLSAWTAHYEPSPTKYALIYWVKVFYRMVIPGTIGFFLVYIAVDVWGRRRHRRSS